MTKTPPHPVQNRVVNRVPAQKSSEFPLSRPGEPDEPAGIISLIRCVLGRRKFIATDFVFATRPKIKTFWGVFCRFTRFSRFLNGLQPVSGNM